jgi:predicted Ser/Thr protein kinase
MTIKGGDQMNSYDELAESVVIRHKANKAKLINHNPSLKLIGAGRSAYVFRIQSTNLALKVFFPTFEYIAKEEAEIYKILEDISYFPHLHGSGKNYIVIDYIEGTTLFDCLRKGIRVSKKHIEDIDHALDMARDRGLNPSDIHLKNLFITSQDTVKLIDVARFRQTKRCSQWDDIKLAFHKFYLSPLFPKRIPSYFLDRISHLYKQQKLQKWFTEFHH